MKFRNRRIEKIYRIDLTQIKYIKNILHLPYFSDKKMRIWLSVSIFGFVLFKVFVPKILYLQKHFLTDSINGHFYKVKKYMRFKIEKKKKSKLFLTNIRRYYAIKDFDMYLKLLDKQGVHKLTLKISSMSGVLWRVKLV